MAILLQTENINFVYKGKNILKNKIKLIITDNNKSIGNVNIIFTSDEHLIEINKNYLKHDYYTDIITFDYNENNLISGDIFISIDRVKDNSSKYSTLFLNELHRIIIHGVLHLLGFNDKSKKEKIIMTEKEDYYLNKYFS